MKIYKNVSIFVENKRFNYFGNKYNFPIIFLFLFLYFRAAITAVHSVILFSRFERELLVVV